MRQGNTKEVKDMKSTKWDPTFAEFQAEYEERKKYLASCKGATPEEEKTIRHAKWHLKSLEQDEREILYCKSNVPEIEQSEFLRNLPLTRISAALHQHSCDIAITRMITGERLTEAEFKNRFEIIQGIKQAGTILCTLGVDTLIMYALHNHPAAEQIPCVGLVTLCGLYCAYDIGAQKPPPHTYVPYTLKEIVEKYTPNHDAGRS